MNYISFSIKNHKNRKSETVGMIQPFQQFSGRGIWLLTRIVIDMNIDKIVVYNLGNILITRNKIRKTKAPHAPIPTKLTYYVFT